MDDKPTASASGSQSYNEESTEALLNNSIFVSAGEALKEELHDVSHNSSKYSDEMDMSSVVVFKCERPVQDTGLSQISTIEFPSAYHENFPSKPLAHHDLTSLEDNIKVERCEEKENSVCSNANVPHDGNQMYQKLYLGNSEVDASKTSTDDHGDREPPPSVGETNDVMVIDVDDDPDTSRVSPQKYYMNFESIPFQITGVWKEFEDATENNFTKGCKWSPDGSCMLSCSEDAKMRLYNLPIELYQTPINWSDVSEMFSVLKVSEAELIYDYCWYPPMSSMDPISCCFVSSSRCNPIHMWDAFTGEMRCTYRPYNHLDEIVAAHGLAFSVDGQKLYCGFKNMIRIFDVSIPGRNFKGLPTCVKKKYGQKGIISCFAFSAENRNVFAAGSYSKTVGIYSETDGSLMHLLDQQKGGVTHMCFSPDGCQLYCGGRNDPEIHCWDMRNLKKPLFQLCRICNTNQRMYFDISRCGQYVVSGNNNGVVTVWDVKLPSKQIHVGQSIILEPVQFYQAHNDCVNGISLHPNLPLLATSSGQRQFPDLLDSEGEESDGAIFTYQHIVKDNSIRLWWTGPSVPCQTADC